MSRTTDILEGLIDDLTEALVKRVREEVPTASEDGISDAINNIVTSDKWNDKWDAEGLRVIDGMGKYFDEIVKEAVASLKARALIASSFTPEQA